MRHHGCGATFPRLSSSSRGSRRATRASFARTSGFVWSTFPERERALWFAASDAVVCPYRHATGSGIAADTLAHGRPVIGTRVDGLAEVVEDGVSGLLVPPGDEAALAAAMRRFVAERMGPRLSAGAVRRASALGPETHARQLLALGGVTLSP